jgi:hypothetical protein
VRSVFCRLGLVTWHFFAAVLVLSHFDENYTVVQIYLADPHSTHNSVLKNLEDTEATANFPFSDQEKYAKVHKR